MNTANKVAIVTGASKGIGRATAIRLAQDGYRIVVNYLSSEHEAQKTLSQIESIGGSAMLYPADVSRSSEVQGMIDAALQRYGQIDLLVNNSGVMYDTNAEDVTDEEWEKVISVNLNSAFYACRAVIPHFKSRNYGRIINISSQAALTGSAQHSHYATAKSGVLGLTYSLAKELGPYGITVNIVSPGRIQTDMISSRDNGRMEEWMAQTPLKRLGKPEDVAHAIAFLASDQAAYITGLNMHVNGGLLMG